MTEEKSESDNQAEFAPDKLPAKIKMELFLRYGISGYRVGRFRVDDFDYGDTDSVPITSFITEITLPKKLNVRGLALKVLEEEKTKIMAENHMRLQTVQEKIDKLKAIEYKPGDIK